MFSSIAKDENYAPHVFYWAQCANVGHKYIIYNKSQKCRNSDQRTITCSLELFIMHHHNVVTIKYNLLFGKKWKQFIFMRFIKNYLLIKKIISSENKAVVFKIFRISAGSSIYFSSNSAIVLSMAVIFSSSSAICRRRLLFGILLKLAASIKSSLCSSRIMLERLISFSLISLLISFLMDNILLCSLIVRLYMFVNILHFIFA